MRCCPRKSHPLNAESPNIFTLSGTSTSENVHPEKAPSPMDSTFSGIAKLDSLHLENAKSPIDTTPLGMVNLSSKEQPVKQFFAMEVILSDISISVNELQS